MTQTKLSPACLFVLLSSLHCPAQNAPLNFEVASIKPAAANMRFSMSGGPESATPGRIAINRTSIGGLIGEAYRGEYGKRILGPAWVISDDPADQLTFAATFPPNTTKAQYREMMRNLLTARFGLKFHTTTKEVSGYELAQAPGGHRLGRETGAPPAPETPSPSAQQPPPTRPRLDARGFPILTAKMSWMAQVDGDIERITYQHCTMADLSSALSLEFTRYSVTVVDRTGLPGHYNFQLELPAPNFHIPQAADGSPIMMLGGTSDVSLKQISPLVEKQIGISLRPAKIQLDSMVIDRISRQPTEN